MADMVVPVGYANVHIDFEVTGSSKSLSTTFGLHIIDPSDDGQTAINAFWGSFVTEGGPCHEDSMLQQWTAIGVSGIYQTEDGPLSINSTDDPVAGAVVNAGGRMILNSATIVTKRSSLASRSGRGRGYWPCLWFSEGAVDVAGNIDTVVSLPAVRDMFTFTTDTWADDTATYVPVILHAEGSPGASTPRVITSLFVQGTLGTQRRRIR